MSKAITLSIDEENKEMFDAIAEANNTDKSKMLRKWIREHWKPEYEKFLKEKPAT